MEERYGGPERRKSPGRVVYSRGPLIRRLEAISIVTGLFSVAALVTALLLWGGTVGEIQSSRIKSATDTCFLLRELVLVSSAAQHKLADGRAFINTTPLNNCDTYGRSVTKLR